MTATIGSWLLGIASVTATFNGIHLLPSNTLANTTLSDGCLLVGAVVLLGAALSERDTWPTYPLVGAMGALLLGISVAASSAISGTPSEDLRSGILFLIGAALTPIVVAAAAKSPRTLEAITFLWLASGAVNGAVAVLDDTGVTRLGSTLTGLSWYGRQGGLAIHPNHLGMFCAMIVPVGFTLALFGRRTSLRAVSATLTVLAVMGVLESGSRGATLGILLGPAVAAVLVSKRRLRTLVIATILIVTTASIAFLAAQALPSVARLTGQSSVQGSDLARLGTLTANLNDIAASPILGNGYGDVTSAHDIYLQVVAAGGVVGLCGFVLLLGAILQSGIRSALRPDLSFRLRLLSAGLVGSVITYLAVGIVENQIQDRALYWPAGLLLAVRFMASTSGQRQSNNITESERLPGRSTRETAEPWVTRFSQSASLSADRAPRGRDRGLMCVLGRLRSRLSAVPPPVV